MLTERVLVDSDAQITGPVFTNTSEEATDTTGTPTVTVVSRVTGETLTAPTVTTESAAGVYSCALTAATHTAALDLLDLTWTGTVSGKTKTYRQTVEVVGGFYESIPGLREITTLTNAATQPLARLKKYRSEIENICEEFRGTAYVERVAVESFDLRTPQAQIRLAHRNGRTLLALSTDGTAKTVGDYKLRDPRLVVPVSGSFPSGLVTVAYTHGHLSPPAALVEACREYVRAKCHTDASNQNRGVSSVTNLATGEVYRFSSPDPRYGRYTGIEEVDARINSVPDERVLIG